MKKGFILVILVAIFLVVATASFFLIKSLPNQQNSDSNSSANSNSEDYSLDDSIGIKCTQMGTTYYFKDGKFRQERAIYGSMISVQLQPDNSNLYSYTDGTGSCQASRIDAVESYDGYKKRIVGAWESAQGKTSNSAVPQCEEINLNNNLFELPSGCQVLN